MPEIDAFSQQFGEIQAGLRGLQNELKEFKHRELAEFKEIVDKRFASNGERVGKIELALAGLATTLEHLKGAQGWNGEGNSWRHKVAYGGGGAGLIALAEMLRHWLML